MRRLRPSWRRRARIPLSLIEDEVKYFYSYQPPDVTADQAALYPKVQVRCQESQVKTVCLAVASDFAARREVATIPISSAMTA